MELLGDDTQELSLILSSVAVGRADVDHLEGWRGTHGDRDRRKGDRDGVSVGRVEEDYRPQAAETERHTACSDLT